jgi:hypothetical protein
MNEKLPTCKCGHTRDNRYVSAKAKYGASGLLALSLAYSAKPLEVVFQCQKCGQTIEINRDPDILEKYRYNSDII